MKAIVLMLAVAAQEAQEFPQPGKEHDLLKAFEGTWDCAAKFFMDPSQPPMEMKGVETAKIELGGFWLLGDFKGDFMGKPFHGKSVLGYSPMKKKFVGTWVDSFMPHLFASEGDFDAAGKVLTMVADGFDPASGKPVKERWVRELKGVDVQTLTFFMKGDDGKERKTGEITYTRKK